MEITELSSIKWNKAIYDEYDNQLRIKRKQNLRNEFLTFKGKFNNSPSKFLNSKIVKYEWNTTWLDFIQ